MFQRYPIIIETNSPPDINNSLHYSACPISDLLSIHRQVHFKEMRKDGAISFIKAVGFHSVSLNSCLPSWVGPENRKEDQELKRNNAATMRSTRAEKAALSCC
ncbi:hypothetical protein RRG08_010581 [Elysia crispata]|uniref:Uncharacterized protein n=1 Tax=Elysia crispata TaxID=231223 RepID=A0AAE0ZU51_9GAST|nr:hypothetical protein RRG08_010581 [Elysia crispata]